MKHRDCASCGTRNGMTRFEKETFTIRHENFTAKVPGLSGWRCGACEEIEFDPQSAVKYAEAGDELVLKAREHTQQEIRRIRKKLHLNQAQAAKLTGGGHNAFSRYESGEVTPMPAVVNLLKLLDYEPKLLDVLDSSVTEVHIAHTKAAAVALAKASAPARKASRALLPERTEAKVVRHPSAKARRQPLKAAH